IRAADDEHTVEELVTDVLIGDVGGCTEGSNINWTTGTEFVDPWTGQPDLNGIAYFEKNGSLFPFEDGIILATRRAIDSEGPSDQNTDTGGSNWPDDTQLTEYMNNVLGNDDGYYNATVLEFDFVPASDRKSTRLNSSHVKIS